MNNNRTPNKTKRIAPDNPVRRRLFFSEPSDPHVQARVDNLANYVKETIAKDRKAFAEKYSFDTENDVPLSKPGTYRWHKNENDVWIGVQVDKTEDPKDLTMKTENENTPDVRKKENVPLLKKRRNETEYKVANDAGVKRRILD